MLTNNVTLNRWVGVPSGDIWKGFLADLDLRLQDALGQKRAPVERRVMPGVLHGEQEASRRSRQVIVDETAS